MVSRFMEIERKTILVQFIAVDPLAFYTTSDGTDLVQNILRTHLAKSDANIFGQEGSVSLSDNGEFLSFEPTDTKNRALHLPIEHLAYCGALRRLNRDPSDPRNPDQILKRDFENVDLANRYAHYIMGPPIFVAVFHGFDNALCYTFVTQSADDACLLVTKLMRAFRLYEQQQLEQQGQINQGLSSNIANNRGRSPSPVIINQPSQPLCDDQEILSFQMANTCVEDPCQDEIIQSLFCNPNLQVINQPFSSSMQHINSLPFISAPQPSMSCHSTNQPTTIVLRTQDACCLPHSSYSYVPQNNFVCQTTHCTQCCLPFN